MHRIVWLTAAVWLAGSVLVMAQSPDQQYVRIAVLIQQADSLQNNNQSGEALAKYVLAQQELRRFNRINPGWNPKIVKFRTRFLAEKISSLAGANPPPMNLDELPPALQLLSSTRPLVIGHRGYRAFAPENTLPSFQLALGAGVDLVELDYRQTQDGVLMVFHDNTLDRTTDAPSRWGETGVTAESRTSSDLRTLDASLWFGTNIAGMKIPLLSEALDLIQQTSMTLIERKSGDPETCLQLLRDKELINRVVVQSFDWEYLANFHVLAPEQVLGAIGPPSSRDGRELEEYEKSLTAAWLDRVRWTGAKIIVWNNRVTREAVQEAHRQDYRVWIYTVNDPEEANRLLDIGVDGLITDNPAMMWKVMALRR